MNSAEDMSTSLDSCEPEDMCRLQLHPQHKCASGEMVSPAMCHMEQVYMQHVSRAMPHKWALFQQKMIHDFVQKMIFFVQA